MASATTLRLAAISDLHLPGPGTEAGSSWHNRLEFETALPRLRRAVEAARAEGVDGLLVLGDVADVGDADALDLAIEACAEGGSDAWLVPGNHDTRGAEGGGSVAAAVDRFGAPQVRVPPFQGVMWNGFTLVGIPLSPADRGYRLDSAAGGVVGDGAPADPPLLCLTHFPVRSLFDEFTSAGLAYAGDLAERAELERDLAARAGPGIVLAGHLHGRHVGADGPLFQLSCGPLIEPPFEITFVTVARSGSDVAVDIRCEAIAPSGPVRLPILSPATGRWEWSGAGWVQTG